MKKYWQWIMYILFGGFFFFVIYVIFEPRLLYFNLQPFFGFDSAFYDYHFQFKQGYISLISNFILQFLYYPFAGAMLITALLLALALIFRSIFRKTISAGYEGIEFVTPLMILLQLKSYTYGLEFLVVLLIAGIIVLGSNYLKQNFILRSIYQLIAIYLTFTILGFVVTFLLAIIFVFSELTREKPGRVILIFFTNLGLLAILSAVLLGPKLVDFEFHQFNLSDPSVTYPAFWYFIFYIGFTFLLALFSLNSIFSRLESKWKFLKPLLLLPLLLILCLAVWFKPLFLKTEKYKTEINFFASTKEWNKVLDLKNKVGIQDRISRFELNRVLFMTGQMSENLYSVPQEWGEFALIPSKDFTDDCLLFLSDLYFEFGYIKASKYWMVEYQTKSPYAYPSLHRLAITSLLQGEFTTAKKYFTILSKSIVYRESSKVLLSRLTEEPYVLMADYIPKNLAIIKENYTINSINPDEDLFEILKVSHQNKIAFEYLMSYYILKLDFESFNRFLPLVKNSGYYKKLPKTYEEVILIYYLNSNRPVNTWEYNISKNTIEKYRDFETKIKTINSFNEVNLKEKLKLKFKDTFWYYMYFDYPKSTKKIKKNKGK